MYKHSKESHTIKARMMRAPIPAMISTFNTYYFYKYRHMNACYLHTRNYIQK